MRGMALGCALLMLALQAQAASLSSFSNQDMTGALKEALSGASLSAVSKLGRAGGYLNNPQVRIPLPPAIAKAQFAMRAMGMGPQLDQLEVAMNRSKPCRRPKPCCSRRSAT